MKRFRAEGRFSDFMTQVRALTGILAMAFLPLALTGCSSNTPVFDQQTMHLLQSSLDTSVSAIGVPGATMTVIRADGATWVGVSGVSSVGNNTPMVPGLKFRVGSLTKTFTATVILQLVQEGHFSLDDSVESILPGVIPNGSQISIRQLLNHTSGLFDYIQAQNPSFLYVVEIANPFRQWTYQELIAIANANPPYFAPGDGFKYSNTNYVLLGMIIEKVTGNTYAQAVTSRILGPLGLYSTSVPTTPSMPAGSTQGYFYDQINNNWANTTTIDPSFAGPAGNVISNSNDLVVWLNALMKGTLINAQLKAEMFTFVNLQGVVTQGSDGVYGLGLEKQSNAIGHTGDFVFGGQAAMYQDQGWAFVVQTNASPSNQGFGFGSESIMNQAMATIGFIK